MGRGCCWEKVPQNRKIWCRMPGTGNTHAVSSPLERVQWPKAKATAIPNSLGPCYKFMQPISCSLCNGTRAVQPHGWRDGSLRHKGVCFFLRSSLSHPLYIHIPTHISCTSPRSPSHRCTHSGTPEQQQGIFTRNVCIESERWSGVQWKHKEMGKLLHGSNRHTQLPINRRVILCHSHLLYIIGDGC